MGNFPEMLGTPSAIFAAWLKSRGSPGAIDFEALLLAHPAEAAGLRVLHAHWLHVAPLLVDRGQAGSVGVAEGANAPSERDVGPTLLLDDPPAGIGKASTELLRRLSKKPAGSRYRIEGEVARGGMGAILRVWDDDIRRPLAMKVVLGKGEASTDTGSRAVEPGQLARFLEEAQVTGQLDHPGIVPVHELGIDHNGRAFFTMKLVRGRNLKSIYDLVFENREGWNETRALSVILKVCEAVAYAHKKGVIHRDLKPANVMVGDFGEVYVMDWGLARVIGRKDHHDIRIAPSGASTKSVRTERREEREETPDSPIVTMDGDVVGTPAYMAPEQARGEVDQLDTRADVYSVGAVIYHLLAQRVPFVTPGERITNRTILARLLDGPPKPIRLLRKGIASELEAICEKAMAREAAHRYRDMLELADDLRAFLERRVVRAYEAGAWAETRQWVRRNRELAGSLALTVVIALCGLAWISVQQSLLRDRNVDLTASNQELRVARQQADDNFKEAAASASAARASAEVANRLKDEAVARERELRVQGLMKDVAEFEALDDSLDYALRQREPTTDWWRTKAHALLDGQSESSLAGVPWKPSVADIEARITGLRALASPRSSRDAEDSNDSWQFADSTLDWWHSRLVELLDSLYRIRRALALADLSVGGAAASDTWRQAIQDIALCEKYSRVQWPSGERLSPQLGLLPLGPDRDSGLWEFVHLGSGTAPHRELSGSLSVQPESGIVFVLLPGGYVPTEVNNNESEKSALGGLFVSAFFLSKYEVTEAQWGRLTAMQPQGHVLAESTLPASSISWYEARSVLSNTLGWLWLPSEAQWEYGCRGGTTSTWWTGNDPAGLRGAANVRFDPNAQASSSLLPVGSLRGNQFGLHDVHGNLWEWCRDAFDASGGTRQPLDGFLDADERAQRVVRGGPFWFEPQRARSSTRIASNPSIRYAGFGIRPARGVTP